MVLLGPTTRAKQEQPSKYVVPGPGNNSGSDAYLGFHARVTDTHVLQTLAPMLEGKDEKFPTPLVRPK